MFTSNLGIYRDEREFGEVVPARAFGDADDPYNELKPKVLAAVTEHFESTIGRPELLNRIGVDNLVVFDFLRPGPAREVFDMQIDSHPHREDPAPPRSGHRRRHPIRPG